MKPLPFVDMEVTRNVGDCGVVAIAMFLGQKYNEVLCACVTPTHKRPHHAGLLTREIVACCKRFGVALRLLRTWEMEEACGLLTVERIHPEPGGFVQHLVLLKWGLIFDSDGQVWEPDTYFVQHDFKPMTLLVPTEEEQ